MSVKPNLHERAAETGVWAQIAVIGTQMAVGVALFAFLGYLVDKRRGGGVLWTVVGTFVGLGYGAYETWRAVRAIEARERAGRDGHPGSGRGDAKP
jgi:F0F1-type ATP synthase assembly protein I